MTELNDIYKCVICSRIIEVINPGSGTLTCHGQPMVRQQENTVDASREKHVPVIEKTPAGVRVKIGAVPHPMEEKHYIEMIEVIADGVSYKKFLKPGDKPEAELCIQTDQTTVREYCNLHGLWKAVSPQ